MERLDCDRMFIGVMETGSFTAAAQRLGTSHGQASKLISRLEKELGVQLFRRSTRALTATDVGRAYYDKVRVLLAEYDALNDSVRTTSDSPSGRVRVSAPVTFGTTQLTQPLIDFARRYPGIELDVSFADRVVNVVDEGFDLALRIGKLNDSALMARKLCDIRIIAVASPDYLKQRGTPSHWGELSQHDCIIDTNFRDPFRWPFLQGEQTVQEPVNARLKFSNAEVCLQAACAGLGIARLPAFVAGETLRNKTIVPVLVSYEIPPLGLFALYPPAKYLAHRSRTLIDFLVEAFAGEPEWEKGW
ncbi:LysR family transcriptional regulator [Erwinia sp. ErVv1]|uniref:LysR family transcriptional regulator n=1 Tax=Erwinia sp. ErVv1 TaxID=1603299 RepID=UPI00082FECE9|nr:LysR family transcriptional regulator [Erwinia sp. ErVv1]